MEAFTLDSTEIIVLATAGSLFKLSTTSVSTTVFMRAAVP